MLPAIVALLATSGAFAFATLATILSTLATTSPAATAAPAAAAATTFTVACGVCAAILHRALAGIRPSLIVGEFALGVWFC